jgi:hypothetical protein
MICSVSPELLRQQINSVGESYSTYGDGEKRKILNGQREEKYRLGKRILYGILLKWYVKK